APPPSRCARATSSCSTPTAWWNSAAATSPTRPGRCGARRARAAARPPTPSACSPRSTSATPRTTPACTPCRSSPNPAEPAERGGRAAAVRPPARRRGRAATAEPYRTPGGRRTARGAGTVRRVRVGGLASAAGGVEGGGDRDLAEADAAVVRRHAPVGEHPKAPLAQLRHEPVKQELVLEDPAGQRHRADARGGAHPIARLDDQLGEAVVEPGRDHR